jgi:hypothetical protein
MVLDRSIPGLSDRHTNCKALHHTPANSILQRCRTANPVLIDEKLASEAEIEARAGRMMPKAWN